MEEWRPTFGPYEVSSEGRVRGPRGIRKQPMCNGYHIVSLTFDGKCRSKSVHRLVAMAFLGPKPFPDAQVDHKNGIKTDNRVENLEYVTRKENARRAVEMGFYKRGDDHYSRIRPECLARGDRNGSRTHPERLARGAANFKAKLNDELVRQIRSAHAGGESQQSIANRVGVSQPNVSSVVRRKIWAHVLP